MSLGIIDFVKKAWTLTMTVIDDDTNRWENQMAALTEFLKRYSWTPNTNIKKGAVIYYPFGLNERLIAQNDGTTGETEPTWASYKEQGQITDGTVVWAIESAFTRQVLNVAIGTIIQQPWTSAPPGFVALHDGPILQRATYPTLWEFVSTYCSVVTEVEWQKRAATDESVGVFSLGDGETTFRCPKMLSFTRGGNITTVGNFFKSQNKEHTHSGTTNEDGVHRHNVLGDQSTSPGNGRAGEIGSAYDGSWFYTETDGAHTHTLNIAKSGGSEAYPNHIVWPYYIRVDDL